MRRFRGIRVGLLIAISGSLAAGCGVSVTPKTPPAPPFLGETIVVAAVGDAAVLPTVIAQRGEWEASRGGSCQLVDKPVWPVPTYWSSAATGSAT